MEAVLQLHGMFRLVLPSAVFSGEQSLPEPSWLANLHAHKLQAATRMHISGYGQMHRHLSVPACPSFAANAQYLAAYDTALHAALPAKGSTGLAAASDA